MGSAARNADKIADAGVCTNRVIGDDASALQRTCCCHKPSDVVCEPVAQCVIDHGSCLRSDWGVCHFPSLNSRTINR